MPEFQFQFQYAPSDLKAVQTASGLIRPSPATTITVWICGLAVCLLILGAIGYWTMSTTIVVVAVCLLMHHVHRIQRRSWGDWESTVHTLRLGDTTVTETFGHSHFEKSWDAFDDFSETDDHFILNHYGKATVIPKRTVPDDQLSRCRTLIAERVGQHSSGALPIFHDWFQSGLGNPVYHFRWQDADIELLSSARLQLFNPAESDRKGRADNPAVWIFLVVLILVGTVILLFSIGESGNPIGRADWLNLLLLPIAVCVPFAIAFACWRYNRGLTRKQQPRIPRDEIHITYDERGLLIGYPQAIAQYGWQDISTFHIGDCFIGFRPNNSMVHVIANHAFGGREQAIEFLLTVEQYRQKYGQDLPAVASDVQFNPESGNPYQPPAGLE